ncbi:MAG: hypothetical protein KC684_03245, partial [Candidatus Omnitrophica bacterium]|nr:hypothetical protein [Candidatus Omnitrophota bacterium]
MAVIFQSLAVLLGAFYVITLTQEVLDRMYSHLQDIVTPFQMTVGTAQTLGFFGLIFALVILIYVLRKKGVFIN